MGFSYVQHYLQDGTGRDGYIMCNNGGFTANYEPPKFSRGQQFFVKKQRESSLENKPGFTPKCVSYKANGGGRDGYI
jgi:hypothetical protein